MGRSQVVRQRILIPPYGGSNPPAPASPSGLRAAASHHWSNAIRQKWRSRSPAEFQPGPCCLASLAAVLVADRLFPLAAACRSLRRGAVRGHRRRRLVALRYGILGALMREMEALARAQRRHWRLVTRLRQRRIEPLDPVHVLDGFRERRYAAVMVDRAFAGIVGGKGEGQVPCEAT